MIREESGNLSLLGVVVEWSRTVNCRDWCEMNLRHVSEGVNRSVSTTNNILVEKVKESFDD